MLNRNHVIDDYRRACGRVAVARMVFVQCECDANQSGEEVKWVTEQASQDPRISGIVARAALEKGDAAEEELARHAGNPLVKGVRRLIQSEPDDAFCLRPDFVRGVQSLARFGFTFDLCLFHRHLANVIQLVRQCPEVNFVLDHLGKPGIRTGLLDPWRDHLRELAALPNVWCKLSGLVTEADVAQWTPSDLRPYVDHALDCFGAGRLMFGSDWPVSSQATELPRWVAALDDILAGCSPDELRRIYGENAERFYRLGPAA